MEPDNLSTKSLITLNVNNYMEDWRYLYPILASCTLLLSLDLLTANNYLDNKSDYPPVTLPRLETLTINRPQLGPLLVTPALKKLRCVDYAIRLEETAPLPALDHLVIDRACLLGDWTPPSSFASISKMTLIACNGINHLLDIIASPGRDSKDFAFPSLRQLNIQHGGKQRYTVEDPTLCAQVLDLRPELRISCAASLFNNSEVDRNKRAARYGARLDEQVAGQGEL